MVVVSVCERPRSVARVQERHFRGSRQHCRQRSPLRRAVEEAVLAGERTKFAGKDSSREVSQGMECATGSKWSVPNCTQVPNIFSWYCLAICLAPLFPDGQLKGVACSSY